MAKGNVARVNLLRAKALGLIDEAFENRPDTGDDAGTGVGKDVERLTRLLRRNGRRSG
jgi:hypothetical protein